MKFIGNEKTVLTLNRFLERGVPNHAFLFSGPQKVGKFTLARQFAASLVDRKKEIMHEAPTGQVLTDLLVVAPVIEEKKGIVKQKSISIEQIRDVQSSLALFPYQGAYKVLIIDSADTMTVGAQNALLKLLEEPNPTSIIILVAHDAGKVLPTLRSRSQNVSFSLVDDAALETIDTRVTYQHMQLACGRPGLLKDMLENLDLFEQRSQAMKQVGILLSGSLVEKFAIADKLGKDTMKAIEQLSLWSWILRKQAHEALKADDEYGQTKYRLIQRISQTIEILQNTNASSRLAIENLLIQS